MMHSFTTERYSTIHSEAKEYLSVHGLTDSRLGSPPWHEKATVCQSIQSHVGAGKGLANFSRQDMFKEASGIGVQMTDRVFRLQPCHGVLPGLGMLQNLPSAVVAHVLAPTPGSRVLDMCASPGGMTPCLPTLPTVHLPL